MNPQRGFSLVELMIALTLGLLVVAAASSIFLGSRTSYKTTSGIAALSDDTRFSTDFLSRAIRGTGLIGCAADNNASLSPTASRAIIAAAVPASISTTGTVPVLTDFGNELSGYESQINGADTNPSTPSTSVTLTTSTQVSADGSAGHWVAGHGVIPTGLPNNFTVFVPSTNQTYTNGLVNLAVQGSDVLVVHNTVQQEPIPITAAIAGGSTSLATMISPTGLPYPLQVGQTVALSDCVSISVFQVVAVSNTSVTVASSTFPGGTGYNAGAMISTPTTSIFFIAPGADGDGALWRGDFNVPQSCPGGGCTNYLDDMIANEVVPDVENMQVLYGVDPGQTGAVTEYQSADQVGATQAAGFDSVESVRVGLLVASPPSTTPVHNNQTTSAPVLGTTVTWPNDGRQRRVVEITVALRDALP